MQVVLAVAIDVGEPQAQAGPPLGAGDLPLPIERAVARHAHRVPGPRRQPIRLADQVEQVGEGVRRHLEQDVARVLEQPRAEGAELDLGQELVPDDVDLVDAPEAAAGQIGHQALVDRREQEVVADAEGHAACAGQRRQLEALLGMNGQRLFDQRGDAPLQDRARRPDVRLRGRQHVNDVRAALLEQRVQIGEGGRAGGLGGQPLGPRLRQIAHRDQLGAWNAPHGLDVKVGDVSGAQQRHSGLLSRHVLCLNFRRPYIR